jgi:hypothetical protein
MQLKTHAPVAPTGRSYKEQVKFLRGQLIEYLYFYKRGIEIVGFKGERDYVNPDRAALIGLKNTVVLHNHPNSLPPSVDDIFAVAEIDAKELHVISSSYD